MAHINPLRLGIFLALVLTGSLVALAGSQGGATIGTLPVFEIVVTLAFLIQWLVFIPAFVFQTEKYFDLTGSLSYITVTALALTVSPNLDVRAMLLGALVIIWAVRLGSFLFGRIHKAGKDDRFDEIKPDTFRFFNAWTIQGLWITLTGATALVAITSSRRKPLDAFAIAGAIVWVIGFAIEVAADAQKSRFNADPANKGRFIQSGLWSRSRHPNYFGEIVLWIGIAIMTVPVLQGWQWVAMLSPVFVTLLLTRVSGVPMLEAKAEKKWGGQPAYEAYKKDTPVLVPRLFT